jgi:hypothetical protein
MALHHNLEYNKAFKSAPKDRQQRRPKRIRARVMPITILVKATTCRASCNAHAAVFMVETAAVAVAAMAMAVSSISKVTEAARRASGRPGNLVHTSSAKSVATGPRTAKEILGRVALPLR